MSRRVVAMSIVLALIQVFLLWTLLISYLENSGIIRDQYVLFSGDSFALVAILWSR